MICFIKCLCHSDYLIVMCSTKSNTTKVNTLYGLFLCFSDVVSFDLSSFVAVTDVCSKAMVVLKYLFFFSLLYLCVVSFSALALHSTLHCALHCAYAVVSYKAMLLLLMVAIAPIGCGTVGFLFCGVVFSFFNHLPKEGGWLLYFNCVVTVCVLCCFLIRLCVVLCSVFVTWSGQNMFALLLLCWYLCYMVVSLLIGTKM